MDTMKKYKSLPVYVVEDHHEALPHVYRSIGSRHLPLYNNTIIHFDSHPDLLLPRTMPADYVWDKYKLFDSLSIENWILPACYAGHIDHIYWIKNHWSKQIEIGRHLLKIGKHKVENTIRVHTNLYYFISDALYAEESELIEVKEVKLDVLEFDNVSKFESESGYYILDIDLDFFSTNNPFLNMYKNADLYNKLKMLYSFKFQDGDDLKLVVDARIKQIDLLQRVFEHLSENDKLDGLENVPESILEQVRAIFDDIRKYYPLDFEVDWGLIHNAGLTCDETELPQHLTSRQDLAVMLDKFEDYVKILPKPTLVTVSRSCDDDYCPAEDVDYLEEAVVNILRCCYRSIDLNLMYEEDKE